MFTAAVQNTSLFVWGRQLTREYIDKLSNSTLTLTMAAKDCADSGANKISCEGPTVMKYIFYMYHSNILLHLDLERLIQESQPTTGDGWKNVRKDEYVQVWQKRDPNRPVHLIRVRT